MNDYYIRISTHSLTRRLTLSCNTVVISFIFQLTASQGGWLDGHNFPNLPLMISTHSLTRRLTHIDSTHLLVKGISTHSLTRRLTFNTCGFDIECTYFNSQPHKEADYEWAVFVLTFHYFNSQPHKEADHNGWSIEPKSIGFQLTASQGGWLRQPTCLHRNWHFNSQPHKEADDTSTLKEESTSYFNSQPHKEADRTNNVFDEER